MSTSPFGFEKPKHSPGFSLWQTTMCWQRLIKQALEPYNISHAQFVILACLLWRTKKQKTTMQVDIIKMSKLDKMTISKSLKKLATMNLLTRTESALDTRAKIVRLTISGTDFATKLVPIIENIDKQFFGKLEQSKQENLIENLQKLSK